jgi:hypothetical protein
MCGVFSLSFSTASSQMDSFLFYRLAKEDQEKNGKDIPQTGQGNCRAYHPKHIGFFGTHGI